MKQMVGYFGIIMIVVALVALVAQSVMKARHKGEDGAPAAAAPRKERKARKAKPPKEPKKKAQVQFSVPGSPEPPASAPKAPQADAFQKDAAGAYGAAPMEPYRREQMAAGTVLMDETGGFGETQVTAGVPALHYTGTAGFPPQVRVTLRDGTFTIGRVDVALGHAQSDFEFPAETKAVSRRHAAISRDQEGYIIQDLGSKAGTFVNGMKLQPQVLYRLENGYTISFGNGGADYIWEE